MSSSQRVGRAASMAEHQIMVEGLEKRDAIGTAKIMRNHLENAIINITKIAQANTAGDKT